jgi:uncharacterized protein YdcH (DUF465 family)
VPAPGASCPNCGSKVSKRAKFCPECGTRLGAWVGESEGVDRSFQTRTRAKPASAAGGADERRLGAEDSTAELEVPPEETGPVPVEVATVEPRWFGVTPPTFLFGLAGATLALAIVFLATAHWLAGGLCLVASALLIAAFAEVVRRRPATAAARVSAEALGSLRARAGYALATLSVRQRSAREIARRRQELLRLDAERAVRLRELGEAVYRDDAEGTDRLRAKVGELDERVAGLEDEVRGIEQEALDRLRKARLEVASTEMVEIPEPPAPEPAPPGPEPTPPVPAPVPEPTPTPVPEPYPPTVPEPYPPPDEVTPPEPARVPEPGPIDRGRRSRAGKK